ncbi:MAG: hypothetical protein WC364_01530 [Eubacteriales bacterium]|jgi:hypothetical protein
MKLKGIKILGVLLIVALVVCMTCATAFASTSVSIYLNNNATPLATYTTTQLQNNFTNYVKTYSSYNCSGGTYKYYDAEGPLLEDVATAALSGSGTSFSQINHIRFYATADGYDTGQISKSAVMNGYYFANPSSPGVTVAPVIARLYGNRGGARSSTNCLRNFYGQASAGEDTMSKWVKNLDKIYLYTS